MAAFVVYFGNPDRGMAINVSGRIDADTALTGAMTSLLYLVAVLPFFFFGFWKGWKLGVLFLSLAMFGPGTLALQAVGSAEREAQAEDVAPDSLGQRIAAIDLIERNGTGADVCRSVCKALLQRRVVETVRMLDGSGTPVAAFALGGGDEPRAVSTDRAGDVLVTLFQDSDAVMKNAWPTWVGGFAEPKTMTRLIVEREGNAILRRTALAFARAETPTWLRPPQSGLAVGDLRSNIEVAMVTEWHSAIAPDAVVEALVALGASDEPIVARAQDP